MKYKYFNYLLYTPLVGFAAVSAGLVTSLKSNTNVTATAFVSESFQANFVDDKTWNISSGAINFYTVESEIYGDYKNVHISSVQNPYSFKAVDLKIPNLFAYNGETYKVVGIDDYAFANCAGITGDLTIINKYISSIGKSAFSLTSLDNEILVIPSNVKSIGQNAFLTLQGKVNNFVIQNDEQVVLDRKNFFPLGIDTDHIYVPENLVDAYEDLNIYGYNFYASQALTTSTYTHEDTFELLYSSAGYLNLSTLTTTKNILIAKNTQHGDSRTFTSYLDIDYSLLDGDFYNFAQFYVKYGVGALGENIEELYVDIIPELYNSFTNSVSAHISLFNGYDQCTWSIPVSIVADNSFLLTSDGYIQKYIYIDGRRYYVGPNQDDTYEMLTIKLKKNVEYNFSYFLETLDQNKVVAMPYYYLTTDTGITPNATQIYFPSSFSSKYANITFQSQTGVSNTFQVRIEVS